MTTGDDEAEPRAGPRAESAEALSKLEELDRVLPRGIEDWVAEREREGLHVPDILKRRLSEKARLRAIFRKGGGE